MMIDLVEYNDGFERDDEDNNVHDEEEQEEEKPKLKEPIKKQWYYPIGSSSLDKLKFIR